MDGLITQLFRSRHPFAFAIDTAMLSLPFYRVDTLSKNVFGTVENRCG